MALLLRAGLGALAAVFVSAAAPIPGDRRPCVHAVVLLRQRAGCRTKSLRLLPASGQCRQRALPTVVQQVAHVEAVESAGDMALSPSSDGLFGDQSELSS